MVTNQEFEIVVGENEDVYELEKEVRTKIKDYNNKGYRCVSQSIAVSKNLTNSWVVSLLFVAIEYEARL